MKKDEEEICVVTAIRELWKAIDKAQNLQEAKQNFKQAVLKLILEEQ